MRKYWYRKHIVERRQLSIQKKLKLISATSIQSIIFSRVKYKLDKLNISNWVNTNSLEIVHVDCFSWGPTAVAVSEVTGSSIDQSKHQQPWLRPHGQNTGSDAIGTNRYPSYYLTGQWRLFNYHNFPYTD